MTAPEINNSVLYIEVLRRCSEGFWEIDMKNRRALFREHGFRRPPNTKLHDYHDIYTTIFDFIHEYLKIPHVKEVVYDTKYYFSNDPFCIWEEDAITRKIHCVRSADVYKNGLPYCKEHAHVRNI